MPILSPTGCAAKTESKTARSAHPRRRNRVPCEERQKASVDGWRTGHSPGMAMACPGTIQPAHRPIGARSRASSRGWRARRFGWTGEA